MKPNRQNPLLAALAFALSVHSAHAQTTRYWDNNGTAAGFGSAGGTWTVPTVSQWSSGTGASAGTATPGASITTAINDPLHFGTDTTGNGLGGGTITVSGTVDAASLRFGSQTTSNVTLSGGTINLAATTSIHVGAGSTTNHTISSSITGAATSLTKTGNTLTLSGTNSYIGSTLIPTGTLILGSTGALGGNNPGVNGTSGITIGTTAGATLQSSLDGITVHAPITTANSGVNSNIAFGRNTNATGSITLNGAIGGAGNVIFTTAGTSNNNLQTILLGAAGTYTGTTTITSANTANSMFVKAGVDNALPATTVLTINGGNGGGSGRTSAYDLNGFNQTLAGLTNTTGLTGRSQRVINANSTTLSTLTVNNATDYTYSGTIGNTTNIGSVDASNLALTKNGTGTFTITSGGNNYFGATKVLGGILSLGNSNAMRQSPLDTAMSVTGDATNGLRTTVTTLTMGGLTGNKNLATVFTTTTGGYDGLTALTLNPVSGATHTYSADIGDGATGMNLIKTGAGTQILAAAQSYTGTTTGSAGLLFATTTAALPGYNVAGKVIFNGGTIGVPVGGAGWTTADVDALLANATRTSGALGIDTTNGNLVQWTPFTTNFGSLGLNKLGANDLTLNQANTYTGTTTVTQGTLTLANANALQNSPLATTGAGTISLGSGTILNLGGLSGATGDLAAVISNYSIVTAINLNTPATLPNAALSYGGIISDGVPGTTLTKSGAGVQALSGANSYTGATQVDGGFLVFRNKAAKTSGTATAAAAGSIGLGVKDADAAFYSATEVGDLFNTNSLTGFVLAAASGVGIDTTAASFDQTVALTAARSLTKLGGNTLTLSQTNTYTGATTVNAGTLSLTGSLDGGGAISTVGSSVFSQTSTGVISGASTFTQGSTGTSSLAGSNTYTGVTNVNLGQLTISNADALGTTDGNTIVATGGRLAMATAGLSVAEPLTITGTGTTATNGAINFGGAVTGMALTGPITLGGAALIQADGDTGSTLSGGISLGGNVLTINTDGGATQTINTTAIAGTGGSLVKSGSGTLVLGVANSYTGTTTVNLGTLSITDNDALGTTAGNTTVNGGNGTNAVTLTLSNATSDLTVAEPLNLAGSTAGRAQLLNSSAQNHILSGPIDVTSDTNLVQFTSNAAGSITVSGDISGTMTNGASLFLRGTSTSANNRLTGNVNLAGNLSKTDAGTWLVGIPGKTYNWTDTVVAVGSLKMGLANVLPSTTVLILGNATGGSTGTLDLNGSSQTVGGIVYNGQGTATGTRTITSPTAAVLTVNNATDFTTTGTNVSTNNVVLTGALSLVKQGAGTLALNGVNTYSGDTTVNEGILSLTKADSALDANTGNDLSTVSIAATAGATLDLGYTGTDEVNALFISGVQKAPGVWGAIGSGAQFEDAKITGTGTLTVATGPVSNNYTSWASLNGVTGGPNGDSDNDGVKNLVEYALADGQERGTLTGNTLGFTKRGAPWGTDLTYEIETSDNLGISDPWSPVTPDVNNATTISFTLQNPGDNFGRLKVTQVP